MFSETTGVEISALHLKEGPPLVRGIAILGYGTACWPSPDRSDRRHPLPKSWRAVPMSLCIRDRLALATVVDENSPFAEEHRLKMRVFSPNATEEERGRDENIMRLGEFLARG